MLLNRPRAALVRLPTRSTTKASPIIAARRRRRPRAHGLSRRHRLRRPSRSEPDRQQLRDRHQREPQGRRSAAPSIDWAERRPTRSGSARPADRRQLTTRSATAPRRTRRYPPWSTAASRPTRATCSTSACYRETVGSTDFLHLFWHRVQEPRARRTWTSSSTSRRRHLGQRHDARAHRGRPAHPVRPLAGRNQPAAVRLYWLTDASFNPPYQAPACRHDRELRGVELVPLLGQAREPRPRPGLATGSINTTAIPAAESDGLGATSPAAHLR